MRKSPGDSENKGMLYDECMEKFDFVALGDTTTDAFIRLSQAEIQDSLDHSRRELCVEYGAKIPYDSVTVVPAVGNAANAAIAAARLGLTSALITDTGDDDASKEHLVTYKNEHVGREFIHSHPGMHTNYHYVMWYSAERTILVKHEEYQYKLPDFGDPKWLYLTSLGSSTLAYHLELEHYLMLHPSINLAFQPGTFQMSLGLEKMRYFYKRSKVFICNVEEAQKILDIKSGAKISELVEGLRAIGPKIILITDGPNGAYMFDGESAWFMPVYPDPKPPFERTGAGDAFASTFVAALALGLRPEEALRWAPINSMSVVQYIGAREGLLTLPKLKKYLEEAPKEYVPLKLH